MSKRPWRHRLFAMRENVPRRSAARRAVTFSGRSTLTTCNSQHRPHAGPGDESAFRSVAFPSPGGDLRADSLGAREAINLHTVRRAGDSARVAARAHARLEPPAGSTGKRTNERANGLRNSANCRRYRLPCFEQRTQSIDVLVRRISTECGLSRALSQLAAELWRGRQRLDPGSELVIVVHAETEFAVPDNFTRGAE